jgi:uncharacterized membrane protein
MHIREIMALMPQSLGGERVVNVGDMERWASSVAGGALLALGLRRGYLKSPLGIGALVFAGQQIYRGVTGYDYVYAKLGVDTSDWGQLGGAQLAQSASAVSVEQLVTIDAPVEDVYAFWRNFEHLPQWMSHLESVRIIDDRRSHWVAKAPLGTSVEWDAEITEERPNELIAWRSVPPADIPNSGRVQFEPATGGRGVVVRVKLDYQPPAGQVGALVAKLFGEEPNIQVASDLRRLKQVLEAGEIPTTEGQPTGKA